MANPSHADFPKYKAGNEGDLRDEPLDPSTLWRAEGPEPQLLLPHSAWQGPHVRLPSPGLRGGLSLDQEPKGRKAALCD